MNSKHTKTKIHSRKQRAVSPILATVILLAVTVVGGGITFALLTQGVQSTQASNVIFVENAQAVKGTDHADVTATVKNAGSVPWTKVEMTVGKSALSEPILYESLHENVAGCDGPSTIEDCGNDDPIENRDNPLRIQWLIHLDKLATDDNTRTDGEADIGEGAAVGRKLVFESKDSYRSFDVLNGTDIAPLFGGADSDGNTSYDGNIPSADQCTSAESATPGSPADCSATFDALDSSTDGTIFCHGNDDDAIAATCHGFTHTNIEDSPVSPGNTIYFYADAFVEEIPGLGNLKVDVGDGLVVNLFTTGQDGSTARAQTIIKVQGI